MMKPKDQRNDTVGQKHPSKKKDYQKPRVLSIEKLEVVAVDCSGVGKAEGEPGNCFQTVAS